jgi:hypothetical protein
MKRWSFGSVSLVFIALCMFAGGNVSTFGQDCLTGQCVKSPSDRVLAKVAEVVVAAVEVPVRVVEHVVCESQPVRSLVACNGLAQWKAERQAASGRMYHVGGGFGGGNYEGVGFSTSSPDAAIRACCYWGRRPVMEIGVARGRNGWYATVIYR